MDRRNNTPEESGYTKDLSQVQAYDDKIVYKGKTYRVPYKVVKEAVIKVSKDSMHDLEHAARLQYRLMLLDSVIKAKVEFVKGIITIVYNPKDSPNSKAKASIDELIEFISKEGVLQEGSFTERDLDYFEEIYKYQFEPATIREHPPYGYTIKEWKSLKPGWENLLKEKNASKHEDFKKFQEKYLEGHPALAGEYSIAPKSKRPSIFERIFGPKDKEKGFWFHGL